MEEAGVLWSMQNIKSSGVFGKSLLVQCFPNSCLLLKKTVSPLS